MTTFSQIAAHAQHVAFHVNKGREHDGLPQVEVTGNLWLDINTEAVWVEVEDAETRTTHWASLDFPEYAAHGEQVVVAVDQDDRDNFDANRQPQPPEPTYSVVANEIDNELNEDVLYTGLTRAQAFQTAITARQMGEEFRYNYFIRKEK